MFILSWNIFRNFRSKLRNAISKFLKDFLARFLFCNFWCPPPPSFPIWHLYCKRKYVSVAFDAYAYTANQNFAFAYAYTAKWKSASAYTKNDSLSLYIPALYAESLCFSSCCTMQYRAHFILQHFVHLYMKQKNQSTFPTRETNETFNMRNR